MVQSAAIRALLFVYHLCVSVATDSKYRLITEEAKNQTEANFACSSLGESWGLPSDRTMDDRRALSREMDTRSWQTMWLSHVKQDLPQWTWANGSIYTETLSTETKCAYFDTAGNNIKTEDCVSSSRRGYICQMSGSECPSGLLARITQCVQHEGLAYIMGCAVSDWYAARWLCRQANGSLLSRSARGISFNYLGLCQNPWIGLHKEEWVFQLPSTQKYVPVTERHWTVDGGYQTADSSVMRREGGATSWVAVAGSKEHHFLCQNYDVAHISTQTTPRTETKRWQPAKDSSAAAVTLGICLGLVCVVLVGLGIMYCRLRKKMENSQRRPSDSVTPTKYWISENTATTGERYKDGSALYAMSDSTWDANRNHNNHHQAVAAGSPTLTTDPTGGGTGTGRSTHAAPVIDPTNAHLYAVPDLKRKSHLHNVTRGSASVELVENEIYEE